MILIFNMLVELNLIENSFDYLEESLNYYLICDEYGEHNESYSTIKNKVKWKTAFILLVQSFELLVKAALEQKLDILIYENIDSKITGNSKTVSGSKGIERLLNIYPGYLNQNEIGYIKECINIRNDFIHSNAKIESDTLKPKYCKLFEIYVKLINKLNFDNKEQFLELKKIFKNEFENLLYFSNNLTIYRHEEMTFEKKSEFIKEIEKNKNRTFLCDSNVIKYKRIAYGQETIKIVNREFCPDCLAKLGEYHLPFCDIEECPICHGQLLSCDCDIDNEFWEDESNE